MLLCFFVDAHGYSATCARSIVRFREGWLQEVLCYLLLALLELFVYGRLLVSLH